MITEVIRLWLDSGRPALVAGHSLRPLANPAMPKTPLVITRGQATGVFLSDEARRFYIVKKFHVGNALDTSYLRAIGTLVPRHVGFQSAIDRRLLTSRDVSTSGGAFAHPSFLRWIDGTILMPRCEGMDWACVADDLREGDLQLTRDQRLTLASNLTELVALMESQRCAHRDFSCGNIFIDIRNWTVRLIDFDSFFHPTLTMPAQTTCGTSGYSAPWCGSSTGPDPRTSWCEGADRYSLAVVIAELLVLEKNSPLAEEGGLFEQKHLQARSGVTFESVRKKIRNQCADIATLLDRALFARSFKECPGPTEWLLAFDLLLGNRCVPQLSEVVIPDLAGMLRKMARPRPLAPIWPVPQLSDVALPAIDIRLLNQCGHTKPRHPVVTLPANPWPTIPAKV